MKILPLFFAFASVIFADSMCVELCSSCVQSAEDETCTKISANCNCEAIADSLSEVKKIEIENHDNSILKMRREFAEPQAEGCFENFCSRRILFVDGNFKKNGFYKKYYKYRKNKKFLEQENLKNTATEPMPNELDPMPRECVDVCGSCLLNADELKSEISALCEKIENEKSAHLKIIINTLQAICLKKEKCEIDLVFFSKNFKLVNLQENKIVAPKMEPYLKNDTIQNESERELQNEKVIDKKQIAEQIFYKGIEVYYGNFSEKNSDGLDAGLGFFARWYFYQFFYIKTGLNFSYHDIENIKLLKDVKFNGFLYKASVNYKNIALELPLQIRGGKYIGEHLLPFVTLQALARKPIAHWGELNSYYDVENNFSNYQRKSSGTYDADAFEILFSAGAGLQFTEHFILEFLFFLKGVYVGDVHEYDIGSWRIKFNYAW